MAEFSRFLYSQHGMSSLIWASGRGHSEVVSDLLNAGANLNAADKVSVPGVLSSASVTCLARVTSGVVYLNSRIDAIVE